MKLSDGQRSFIAGLDSCFEKARKGYMSGTSMSIINRAAEIYDEITGEHTNTKCGSCIISMLVKLEKIVTSNKK